jgi:hypothetical protein
MPAPPVDAVAGYASTLSMRGLSRQFAEIARAGRARHWVRSAGTSVGLWGYVHPKIWKGINCHDLFLRIVAGLRCAQMDSVRFPGDETIVTPFRAPVQIFLGPSGATSRRRVAKEVAITSFVETGSCWRILFTRAGQRYHGAALGRLFP